MVSYIYTAELVFTFKAAFIRSSTIVVDNVMFFIAISGYCSCQFRKDKLPLSINLIVHYIERRQA